MGFSLYIPEFPYTHFAHLSWNWILPLNYKLREIGNWNKMCCGLKCKCKNIMNISISKRSFKDGKPHYPPGFHLTSRVLWDFTKEGINFISAFNRKKNYRPKPSESTNENLTSEQAKGSETQSQTNEIIILRIETDCLNKFQFLKLLRLQQQPLTSFLRNDQEITISTAKGRIFHWFIGSIPANGDIILSIKHNI